MHLARIRSPIVDVSKISKEDIWHVQAWSSRRPRAVDRFRIRHAPQRSWAACLLQAVFNF